MVSNDYCSVYSETASLTVLVSGNPIAVDTKVLLKGAYDSNGLMNTELYSDGHLPNNQPYSASPWNYSGAEMLNTIPAVMTDWVMVELRDAGDMTNVIERRAGILVTDGAILDTNMSSGLDFYNVDSGNYYVVVRHRNHLPVMSVNPVYIPNETVVDLTDTNNVYGSSAAVIALDANYSGMINGDVNKDGQLKYSGPNNDRGFILQQIVTVSGSSSITSIIQGYYDEDVNLNSDVQYSGAGNDASLIIQNLVMLTGQTSITSVYNSPVPDPVNKASNYGLNNGPFDILLDENNSTLDIKIRTSEEIKNAISDNIQFTLVWDSKETDMSSILRSAMSEYNIRPQGNTINEGSLSYQVFAMAELRELPDQIKMGEEIVIMSILKKNVNTLSDKLNIADDEFTANINGNYYISLYGFDKTGKIISNTSSLSASYGDDLIKLYPNPVDNGLINVEVNVSEDQELNFRLMDVSSRLMINKTFKVDGGCVYKKLIDLSELSQGTYLVQIKGKDVCTYDKIVIK